MASTDELREQVVDLLRGGGAHAAVVEALESFPAKLRGEKPRGSPHTAWEILEHMRIAQGDLLAYSTERGFESPEWPAGYWPSTPAPPDARAWSRSLESFVADLEKLVKLASDRKRDLLAPLAHAPDTNLLLELFLVASHNSYHLGQVMLLRRMLEAQPRAKRRSR
jgi:uncharacterized damage-inducible protein DinB